MLHIATHALIERAAYPLTPRPTLRMLAHLCASQGNLDDARALTQAFLQHPRPELLGALRALADQELGLRLLTQCTDRAGHLLETIEDSRPELLLTLGYLGVEPAAGLLWRQALQGDWSTHRAACMGLLGLQAPSLQASFYEAVSGCLDRPLFSEFYPALVGKTGHLGLLLPALIEAGRTIVSTDCNGGILLALGLHANPTRLLDVLLDPRWECESFATGSAYCAYLAIRCQKLSLLELLDEARVRDRLELPIAMLELHLMQTPPALRQMKPPAEDLLQILDRLDGLHTDRPPLLQLLNDDALRPRVETLIQKLRLLTQIELSSRG